jgi:hypothetical protein
MGGVTRKRFAEWLADSKVDQKREDALLLLKAIEDFLSSGEMPDAVDYSFEWTQSWETAPWRNNRQRSDLPQAPELEAILDELRLEGAYEKTRLSALLRLLAVESMGREGLEPDRREISRTTNAFRLARGLVRRSDLDQWATDNDTNAEAVSRMLVEKAACEMMAHDRDAELQGLILDLLREDGRYVPLRERALAKVRVLGQSPGKENMMPPLLASWFFESRLEQPIPDNVAEYAEGIGFRQLDDFYQMLVNEYAYLNNGAENAPLEEDGK